MTPDFRAPSTLGIRDAFLDAIFGTESPGYNVLYGGGTFDSYADHPRKPVLITTGPNAGKYSTAAGKPQFLAGTWDEVKRELDLPDFSPQSQRKGAWHLADKAYHANTGGYLEDVLATGDPQAIGQAAQTLSGTWTSLPGGIEQATTQDKFVQSYNDQLANARGTPGETQMAEAQPKSGPWERFRNVSQFDMMTKGRSGPWKRFQSSPQRQYEALPGWAKPFVAADDLATVMGDGMTFGLLPKAVAHGRAYARGTDYATERADIDQKINESRERAGWAGTTAELAGGIKTATKLAGTGLTASNIPGKIGKYAGTVLDGVGLGLLGSYGHDQDLATGAATGGLLGAGGQVAGKVGQKVLQSQALKKMRDAAPGFEQVRAAKNKLYTALQSAGVKFDANTYSQMLAETQTQLRTFNATRAPMTHSILNDMLDHHGKSPSFDDIEGLLSAAKGITREKNANEADKAAAGILVNKLTKFFEGAPYIDNGSIPGRALASMTQQARELARRHIIARDVKQMQDDSKWYTSGDETGLRNQASSYGKRQGRNLTETEKQAGQKVVRREGALGVLNTMGNKLTQTAAASAGLLGGLDIPVIAAGLLANYGARKTSEKMTKNSVNNLMKTVLAGREAQKRAKPSHAQMQRLDNLVRGGLLGGGNMLLLQNGQ